MLKIPITEKDLFLSENKGGFSITLGQKPGKK